MIQKPARFTPAEAAFLCHRLSVPDALADVMLAESGASAAAWAGLDHISRECLHMSGQIEGGWRVDIIVGTALLTDLRTSLLRDAVEGSTYVATFAADDPDQDAGRRAAVRAARSAVAKLRAAGFEVGDAPEI